MNSAAGGLRSSATAQPNAVIGTPRSANSRAMRQKPTRVPYSYMLSAARSRSPMGTRGAETSVSAVSERPSPSPIEYSEPSS